MATLTSALEVGRATRNQFNHWLVNDHLPTKLRDTDPGVARDLSRGDTLGLVFMAALARAGVPASDACTLAKSWLKAETAGTMKRFWACNRNETDFYRAAHTVEFDNPKRMIGALIGELPDPETRIGRVLEAGPISDDNPNATELSIIDRHELVRRVDRIMADT